MTETLVITGSVLAGAVLGFAYFGSMWYVVRRLHWERHAIVLLSVTTLLRLAVAVVCFAVILRTCGWAGLVAALLGFLAARIVLVKLVADSGREPDGAP